MGYGDAAAYARLRAWNATGRTATLIRPLARVAARLREHGYTVYAIGNEAHMLADPPEDHTPYSGTGYPGKATYGRLYAIDIMPLPAGTRSKVDGRPLPSIQQLGAQLLADRLAGVPGARWLKYQNWEPEGDYTGPCWTDSFLMGYARRSSSDRGHIHASAYTGIDESNIADDYDLVDRARTEGDDDMSQQANDLAAWMATPSGTSGQDYVPAKGSPARDLEHLRRLETVENQLKGVQEQLRQILAAVAPKG